MDNLSLLIGNSNPFSWLFKMVMPTVLMFAEGDPDPDPDPDPNPDPDPDPDPDPTPKGSFYEGFTEEVRVHPSITKFKSAEDLGKSYIELEKKIGAKGVIIPTEGASEQVIADYRKAIGVPEKFEDYNLEEIKIGDDRLKATPEAITAFKTIAHQLGINPTQFNGLNKWFMEAQISGLKTSDDKIEADKAGLMSDLRKEYGSSLPEKLGKVNQLITAFGDEKLKSVLAEGEGNNPYLTKFLIKLTESIGEDTLKEIGTGGLTLTPSEAEAEIQKIYSDKAHAWHNPEDPNHNKAVKYMTTLYELKEAGTK